MNDLERAIAFAPVLERLGKLLPRLASDHAGEVVATAAAIGRTLAGAGLDWHDLTARVTALSALDVIAAAAASPAPQPATGRPSEPTSPVSPAKPKRQPSPWPTWSTLSHFGRLGMFATILAEGDLPQAERDRLMAAHEVYRRQQIPPSGKDQRTFNAACRRLWEAGWRPAARAA